MRYYEQKYPEVDELVMVQVRQIAEMGAYVKLVCTQVTLPKLVQQYTLNPRVRFHSSNMTISRG